MFLESGDKVEPPSDVGDKQKTVVR